MLPAFEQLLAFMALLLLNALTGLEDHDLAGTHELPENNCTEFPSNDDSLCRSSGDCRESVGRLSECVDGACICRPGSIRIFSHCSSQLFLFGFLSFFLILLITISALVFLRRRRRIREENTPLAQVDSSHSFHQVLLFTSSLPRPESPPPPYVDPPSYQQVTL